MITDQTFWFKWMFNYSFGELMGIAASAAIGRFLFVNYSHSATAPDALPFVILVIAGASEGLIIGYMQWKSLSRLIQNFKLAPWILATTASATAGWVFILPPAIVFISFLSSLKFIGYYSSTFYTALAGLAFGGVIGIPQYFIIKKFYKNAFVWVLANAFGWMLSFIVVYGGLQMLVYSTSIWHNIVIIIISCTLSGLAQGFVTGTFLHFAMTLRSQNHTYSQNTPD